MSNIKNILKHATFSKGFTLIELLVVIAILGIVAAVLLTDINPVAQLQKSSDAHRKTDLESLQRALELYYQDNGSYPVSTNNLITINGTQLNWGSAWNSAAAGQPYMNSLPKDPSSPTYKYVYYSPAGGQSYYLYAHLQRTNDPQACNSGNACTTLGGAGFPAANACGATCNYGVSSPNVTP